MFCILRFFACFLFFLNITYGGSPYAPLSIGPNVNSDHIGNYTYDYDASSNRLRKTIGGNAQTIKMGLVTKPVSIQQGSNDPELFFYGIKGQRYLRVHEDGRKTFYLDGMDYTIDNGVVTATVRIHAKGYSPDVQVDVSNSGALVYTYLLKDHLGSPVRTVDDSGLAADPVRFDPWGRRVAATGVAADISNAKVAEKTRGFTGHERIASAGLDHMNGRVHDFEIGLFAGPDPAVYAGHLVGLNRFSYGLNNPIIHTDVTGYTVTLHDDNTRMIFTVPNVLSPWRQFAFDVEDNGAEGIELIASDDEIDPIDGRINFIVAQQGDALNIHMDSFEANFEPVDGNIATEPTRRFREEFYKDLLRLYAPNHDIVDIHVILNGNLSFYQLTESDRLRIRLALEQGSFNSETPFRQIPELGNVSNEMSRVAHDEGFLVERVGLWQRDEGDEFFNEQLYAHFRLNRNQRPKNNHHTEPPGPGNRKPDHFPLERRRVRPRLTVHE